MAFGSFSTPAAPKAVAGYQPPQTLFANAPAPGPGMVTSNMTASMPVAGMDIQDQIAAYNFAKQQKADREAEWARAAAANRASAAAHPDPMARSGSLERQIINPEEERMKQAFAEVYAPQLRRTFHDQVIASPGAAGEEARRRYGSNIKGGLWSSGSAYNTGKIRPEGQDQERLNQTLAAMWRAETDPYLKAVGGGMDAQTAMSAMQPGKVPYGYPKVAGGTQQAPYWKRPGSR